MSITLVQGTKQTVNCTVTDTSGVLTTLDGTTPNFTVVPVDPITDLDTTPAKYTSQSCVNSGMMAQPLVDTNNGGLWAKGKYRLYLMFATGSQVPKLGPVDIYVI